MLFSSLLSSKRCGEHEEIDFINLEMYQRMLMYKGTIIRHPLLKLRQ